MATEAGTDYSGVLCGRATWKDGMPIYATQGREGARGLAVDRGREEHQRGERGPDRRDAVDEEDGHRGVESSGGKTPVLC